MASSPQNSHQSYEAWMGMPVFLEITTGEITTPLFCTVIGESDTTVRVRIADQWDVDICKEVILVVDAFPHAAKELVSHSAEDLNRTTTL